MAPSQVTKLDRLYPRNSVIRFTVATDEVVADIDWTKPRPPSGRGWKQLEDMAMEGFTRAGVVCDRSTLTWKVAGVYFPPEPDDLL